MARIFYRSSAGLLVVAAVVAAVMLLGTNRGIDVPTVQAQSSQTARSSAAADGVEHAVKDALRVTAVSPTVEDLHRATTQPAHIEAFERTDVYAKASGFLAKVNVDIGDRVEQDQVLAELWIPEMDQEKLQKAALIEQAGAAVEQAEARLASADALIAAAEAKLAEAHSAIEQHEAEVEYRRSEHRRFVELVKSRSVNAGLEDEKQKQLKSATAALAAAQSAVQSAEAGVQVEQARKLQARADVAHAQSQLKVAEANLRQTEILMQYAQIRAPYPGLITRRWADTGDFVASAANSKSDPLFTVDRVDKLRIVFDVPESESALIQVGQRASLVVDALKGRSFDGLVARTAGVLEPQTRTLRVEAELHEPDAALRAGMYGMVAVTLAERPQAVMLPARSIRFENKKPFVFCVDQGIVMKRPVTLGFSDGTRSEIVEGVGPADVVVLESRFPVHPGRPVEVAKSR